MKVLIVLRSHDKLGNTGFWLEEFAEQAGRWPRQVQSNPRQTKGVSSHGEVNAWDNEGFAMAVRSCRS
jgi:hypothetical protein